MAYAGARGTTEKQMRAVLHFTLEQKTLHETFAKLIETQKKLSSDKCTLHIANALWGQEGYRFLEEFLALTGKYGAGLQRVNFQNSEEARKTINAWVEEQTRQKIKDLIPQGGITGDTRLVLTNAIYFKGDWLHKFDKADTKEEAFRVSARKTVQVPMMWAGGLRLKYIDGGTFSAVELPYRGEDLSMVIFLPKEIDGLPDFEKNLTGENLQRWLSDMRQEEIGPLAIPRFKIDSGSLTLKKVLEKMGMKDAFSRAADFSGMDGTKTLFIWDALHKAFVEVNEEGTEAAAATAIVMKQKGVRPATRFVADHPFFFVIRENATGSILFMGRLTEPAGK